MFSGLRSGHRRFRSGVAAVAAAPGAVDGIVSTDNSFAGNVGLQTVPPAKARVPSGGSGRGSGSSSGGPQAPSRNTSRPITPQVFSFAPDSGRGHDVIVAEPPSVPASMASTALGMFFLFIC